MTDRYLVSNGCRKKILIIYQQDIISIPELTASVELYTDMPIAIMRTSLSVFSVSI